MEERPTKARGASKKLKRLRKNLELLDAYVGDIVEELVYEHRYPVNLAEEYNGLLYYVYKMLAKSLFGGRDPTPQELEDALAKIRERHPKKLRIVLSYAVANYAEARKEELAGRVRWWEK